MWSFKKKPVIVTHSGSFHADDCMAVAALLIYLKKDLKEVLIIRSRDPEEWVKGDFVVDVGGEDLPESNKFDHHQEGGAGKRQNGIPYAAFGLVWKKFGKEIAGASASMIEKVLVEPLDASDTGVEIVTPKVGGVYPYTLERIIVSLRPTWDENEDRMDEKFLEGVVFSKKVLESEIQFWKSELNAAEMVMKAYQEAPDKRLVTLEKNYPFEAVLGNLPDPLFAVYPRTDNTWGVKTIRKTLTGFENRRNLPEAWAGKRNEELARITGVSDAVFCHNGRFMAVAKTKEGAVKLATLAINS